MKHLFGFFSPPVFPDDEIKTRSAYYLNAITLISFFFITLMFIVRIKSGSSFLSPANLTFLGIISSLVVIFLLIKFRLTEAASRIMIIALWIAATLLAISGNGSVGNQAARYIVIIAFTGLIIGYRSAILVAVISILSVSSVSYLQALGIITQQADSPAVAAVQASIPLVLSAVFIYLSISSLQTAIEREKEDARELSKNNEELKELHKALEAKVKERTEDVIKADMETHRRAAQFQTITQVAQKITSERNLDALLSTIVEVIASQFSYHHVAVYLNDEIEEFTILSAASSNEGKRMMERGYKVPIKSTSLIGHVAATGNLQIATATSEKFDVSSADLPATRFEFALPLKSGSQIIGVLDVQSDKESTFDEIDNEALVSLAHQITIAVQNTRLFAETQTALAESQLLYGTVVKQTWKSAMQTNPQIGYRYAGVKPVPMQHEIHTPEIREALENENIAITHPSRRRTENALAVPLKLRESTIGVINVNFPVDMEIGEDEVDVITSAAQRIALALENASLLEESQRRAKREQTISEMSAKIGSGSEIETILKTAIHELSSHISSSQITIELGTEEEG